MRLLHSRGEAEQQSAVKLQITSVYFATSDKQIATQNWQFSMQKPTAKRPGANNKYSGANAKPDCATVTRIIQKSLPIAGCSIQRRLGQSLRHSPEQN